MPQRNVATNFTFEQQRAEINLLASDFWTQKGTVDTAASTYLKHDGSNAFTGQTLAVPNAFTINSNSGNGTVTIAGNLQVDGTTTTVNTATMDVVDKNITIAKGSANDAAADGAGITIDSATDITWNFVDAKDAWVSSIGVESTTFLKAGGLVEGNVGHFKGTDIPSGGQGVEINAPDGNTGQIISYDRGNSAYKELRLKGSSVGVYTGTTNALAGTFNSTGLTMESGKTITGVLATAAQTNITSVGTLTSLDVTGTLSSGNITISTDTDASFFINTTNANGAHLRLQTSGTTKTYLGQASGIAGSLGNANDFAIRSAEAIVFSTNNNNTTNAKIHATGEVQIGDSTKSALGDRILQIGKTDRTGTYIEVRTSTTGVGGFVFSDGTAADNTGYRGTIEYDHGAVNADEMYFKTAAIERLRITSTGQLSHTANRADQYTARFKQAHTSNPAWIEIDSPADSNVRPAYIQLQNAGTDKWGIGQVYASTAAGAFHLCAGTASESTSKLTLTTGGNLGIGNVNPNWPLTVERSSGTTVIASKNTGGNATVYIEASNTNTAKLELTEAGTGSYSLQVGNDNALMFFDDSDERMRITSSGHVIPGADNTQDLGSSSKRWANVYTGDLNLCNEGSYNEVDGTSGSWTMQEGDSDLFLINRKSGKKYKFNLTEVS